MLGVVGSLVSPATAASLTTALARARADLGDSPDAARLLRAQLSSPEPYLRATALYLLEGMDQASGADFDRLDADEHPIVRETAAFARARCRRRDARRGRDAGEDDRAAVDRDLRRPRARGPGAARPRRDRGLVHRRASACAARASRATRCSCCSTERSRCRSGGTARIEGPGSCIGELAVLDPAPREATVVASTIAVRTLRLTGGSFRQALGASPVVSRGHHPQPGPAAAEGEGLKAKG